MKKNYGIIIWLLLLALTLFLTLIIPKNYTNQVWTVIGFDIIAFVSQFITWFLNAKSSKETFYKYPIMTISSIYLGLQFIYSLVVSMVNEAIPYKTVLIINFVMMVIMLILIVSTLMTRDKVESLDFRRKDHHTEI
jgi:hypothetical protein